MYFTRLFVFAAATQAISAHPAPDNPNTAEGHSLNVSEDLLFGDAWNSGLVSIQPFGSSAYVEFSDPSLKSKQYIRELQCLGVLIQLLGTTNYHGVLLDCTWQEAVGKAFRVIVYFGYANNIKSLFFTYVSDNI